MRHLCLMIGGERFALATKDVHEVAPAVAARRVPGAPEWCLGLACARGTWLPLVHAAALLGLPATAATTASRTLLMRPEGAPALLLLVDEVLEFVELDLTGSHPGLAIDDQAWLGAVCSPGVQVLHAAALARHPALGIVRDGTSHA
ncbi:MAG: chemotaxis protein CheW [Phycisphaerae bacterium]|nr:chemotaxis protein CheW [Phycisphaerae bacterium]